MKASTLLLLVAAAAESYAFNDEQREHVAKAKHRRQALGLMTTMMGKGGKVSAGWGDGPARVELTPNPTVPGAKRTKMRYGPYSVIGMEKTSILGEGGALWNYPDTSVAKPASDMTIFGMVAGLEHADGSDANIDQGLWLHHMVQFNIGWGRQDATCAGTMSLPHFNVGSSPTGSERMFSSGNERSFADLTRNGKIDVGYHVTSSDSWALIVDLMNMNMEDKTVYMTITYDYVPGFPAGWDDMKPVWFDVNQCGTSEVSPLKNSGSFTIESRAWSPNFEGEIVGLGAHVHDGGINLEILNNPNSVVCDSHAEYGGSEKYILPQRLRMGPEKWAVKHISHMGMCYGADLKKKGLEKVRKGQSWTVRAHYDYDKAAGNQNAFGTQEEIMAISIMYVRIPRAGVSLDMWLGATAANPSMGATFSGVMSNIGSNLGLASLFGGGSSSSSSSASSSKGSMGAMLGMNMRRALDFFQSKTE